jgi:hypothetical protein
MAVRANPIQEGGQNGGDQQVIDICLFLFPENGHRRVSSSISGGESVNFNNMRRDLL